MYFYLQAVIVCEKALLAIQSLTWRVWKRVFSYYLVNNIIFNALLLSTFLVGFQQMFLITDFKLFPMT